MTTLANWTEIEAFVSRFYQGRRLLITPYGYNIQFTSVAQNATQSQIVTIAANADFMLIGIRHRTRLAAAGQTVSTKPAAIARLLLTDSGSNEQLTAQPVDLENYSSNDAKVLNLDYPRILAGRTTLTAVLTNYAPAAETINTDVFLSGVQIRAYSN